MLSIFYNIFIAFFYAINTYLLGFVCTHYFTKSWRNEKLIVLLLRILVGFNALVVINHILSLLNILNGPGEVMPAAHQGANYNHVIGYFPVYTGHNF